MIKVASRENYSKVLKYKRRKALANRKVKRRGRGFTVFGGIV